MKSWIQWYRFTMHGYSQGLILKNHTQNFNQALWQNCIVAIWDHFHETFTFTITSPIVPRPPFLVRWVFWQGSLSQFPSGQINLLPYDFKPQVVSMLTSWAFSKFRHTTRCFCFMISMHRNKLHLGSLYWKIKSWNWFNQICLISSCQPNWILEMILRTNIVNFILLACNLGMH